MGRPRGAKGGRAARRGAATPPLAGAKRRASRSRSASPVAKRTRLQEMHAKIRDEEEQMGCAGAGGGAGESEGGTGQAELQLLDLPPELVLTILEFCQPFREVARLRLVCRAFDDICCHIIKSGFVKMQEHVSRRIAQLEQEAADLLAAVTGEGSTITCAARRTLQRNLQRQQHLRLLTFQLQLVRALTWRYVDAAACAPPYALLLDTCAALLYGGERGDVRPRAHVHTCRNVAMVLLKNFLRHVEQGQPAAAAVAAAAAPPLAASPRFAGAARDRDRDLTAAAAAYAAADVVLPCACVIDLLEASLASPCPGRNCRITFRPTRSHSVRVQARYDLEGCWLGVYSGSSPHGALHAGDIHLLTSILCDLVCSSSEARLLGLRDPATAGDPNERPHSDADPLKLPGLARGHPPFCVYPRLHNPRQCYRGSIREPSGRVFAFGHAPGERSGLRVFLDLTASVSLVPASLMRRLTPHAPAWPLPPSAAAAAAAQLPASASEPFIPKGHAASAAAATVDAHGRCMPFDLELVFESNAERVVYRSYAS